MLLSVTTNYYSCGPAVVCFTISPIANLPGSEYYCNCYSVCNVSNTSWHFYQIGDVVVRISVHVHFNLGLSPQDSSRTASAGLLHKSDGVIVVWWAG